MAAVVALLCAVGGVAPAATLAKVTVILGQTSATPAPSCPGDPCQAVGRVTGFQVSDGQTRDPFLVRADGTIKAWTLTLAQPTNSQVSFFNSFFGAPAEARLAILRHVADADPPRFSLRRQSAAEDLTPYLGQTAEFAASLKVEEGDVVGVTVPTWAPIFSQGLAGGNVWRASRESGACTRSADIRAGRSQQSIGKVAIYGCEYSTARLLYTATLVKERGHREAGSKLTVKPFQMYFSGRALGRRLLLRKIVVLGLGRGSEVSLKCLRCQGGPTRAHRRSSASRLVFPTGLKVDGRSSMQISVSVRNGSKRIKLYGFRIGAAESKLKRQLCFAGGRPVACDEGYGAGGRR